jgi:hypothetical protein
MTTRKEQAEFKSWLDGIVEPTSLSQRVIPRIGETVIPLTPKQAQGKRVMDFIALVEAGKFASAAHLKKEIDKHNPWVNGVEAEKTRRLQEIYIADGCEERLQAILAKITGD